jgi:hypothetical protein
MAQAAEVTLAADTVEASLVYHLDDGTTPYTYTGGPGSTEVRNWGKLDPHTVVIRNGRGIAEDFSLEREGFRFIHHDPKIADFYDEAAVRSIYYPEMERLVKEHTGASRVIVFDHTLRTADDADREVRKIREPVLRVHNDYTEWSGPQRVRNLVPDEAEELLTGRFAIVQVWRPIRKPVEVKPIAICDARTMSAADFVVSERRYPNRVGRTYAIVYNPAHRWYWFPKMRRDEAIFFKVFDSEKDGRARWTAHTAFDNPLERDGFRLQRILRF